MSILSTLGWLFGEIKAGEVFWPYLSKECELISLYLSDTLSQLYNPLVFLA